jgi:predicted GNAT superfamily acetyltransferase
MSHSKSNPAIVIRALQTIPDLRLIPPVESEVWGLAERDATPMTLLIAMRAAGAIFVGAFDGEALVGFAFGFPALEKRTLSIHSHMLAVLPGYRDLDLGYRLKLAQRDRALELGIREMTWTFDPLQSRNAHFNFAKVGVVSDRYYVDFYGNDSTSVLHQNGTDRLWLTWSLTSDRVKRRISDRTRSLSPASSEVPFVVEEVSGHPALGIITEAVAAKSARIQIPADILAIEKSHLEVAQEWRRATRWAFTELIQSGFFVAEYFRTSTSAGAYLLLAGDMREFAERE